MRAYTGLCFLLFVSGTTPIWGAPPTFAARQVLPLYASVEAVATGDINGDGITDIVSASNDYNSQKAGVSIQFGNPDGTYRQGPVMSLGLVLPRGVAIADFNQDGLPDVAVLCNSLKIFFQQPSGHFTPTSYSVTGPLLFGNLVAADMNRDGLVDLLIPTENGTALLLNAGAGQFQPAVYVNSVNATFVAVADLNNDKNLDLITAYLYSEQTYEGALLVQLGDGHGGFHAVAAQPPFKDLNAAIAITDFNRDGIPDLAVTSYTSPTVITVLPGNGDATFASGFNLKLPSQANYGASILARDINGDGWPDLLFVATQPSASLVVYDNNAQGSFSSPQVYPIQQDAYSVVAVKRTGLLPDLVIVPDGGSYATVLRSDEKGGFLEVETIAATNPPNFLLPGDFNGDGRPDLIGKTGSGIVTYLNTGNNQHLFAPLPPIHMTEAYDLVAGDFNNDGRLDLATLSGTNGQTLLGNGDGTFSNPSVSYYTGPYSGIAAAADMNGDGKLDLVTGYPSIALGNGDGTFAPAVSQKISCDFYQVLLIADFNLDGKLDVLTACPCCGEGQQIKLYLGNGDGTLQKPVEIESFSYFVSITTADFNGDGIPDLAITEEPDFVLPTLSIQFGVGDGTFTKPTVTNLPALVIYDVTAGDFNGDGILDVALLDPYDSVFSVLPGKGDGTFGAAQSFGVGAYASCLLPGRFQTGSRPGYKDVIACTNSGIGVALNTTR